MGLKDIVKKKRDTKYYFYSGKGGVGKTSISAATALHFAKKGKKTLIISTDPAHSLSDSFEVKIGGDIKKLDKNLFAVEIDPKKAMQEYKEKFSPQIEKISMLKGLGLDEAFDIAGMTPGIDEIASFDKFLQYMQSREYDIIVFDTAPTGHALRFLSLPDVLDSWVGKMIKMRMKLSGMVNIIKKVLPFGKEDDSPKINTDALDDMKKRIDEAKKILTDKEKTFYNIVMIPEAMSIYESERSIDCLEGYKIPVSGIFINMIIPENPSCKFCSERRKRQQERIKEIQKKFNSYKLHKVHLMKEEVKGFKLLEKMGKEVY